MTRPRFSQGFTLIELMITLVIVGIVAMIGVPSYLEYTRAAERSEAITTLNDMVMRAEEFRARTGAYPANLSDLGYTTNTASDPGSIPTHTTNNYTYTTSPITKCSGDCFAVVAKVNTANHTDDDCHALTLATNGRRFELNKSQDDGGDSYDHYDTTNCW